MKLHINKEGIKYATLSYWDTAVLLLKVIDFLYFRESELRYMSYARYYTLKTGVITGINEGSEGS